MIFRSLLAPLLILTSTLAQEAPNCRCCNAARVHPNYLKNLPPPAFRKNIGNSALKITTTSAEAQRWFHQGLRHLHGFWEFEAYRCFLEALKHDPDCAMAYWGICMALPGKENEAGAERQIALESALGLAKNISPHEKAYLEMVKTLINSGPTAAAEILAKIKIDHPDDTNAIAWWAFWSKKGYRNGQPAPSTTAAIEALSKALKKFPDDIALNHYLIHILEGGPDFADGMPASISLAKIATDSGHLTHMPGHIHYLSGDYGSACEAFLACDQIETAYLAKEKIPAIDHVNHLHNLHYLVQAASDHGNLPLAIKTAARLSAITPPPNRDKASGTQTHYYHSHIAAAIPYIRSRDFEKAAAALTEDKIPQESFARSYLRFLKLNCELKALLLREGINTNEEMVTAKKLISQQTTELKALENAQARFFAERQPLNLARKAANILSKEAKALLDNAQVTTADDFQFAWAYTAITMDDAYIEPPLLATPVAETLGWLALSKSHPKEAEDFFDEALKRRPKSGHIMSGLAQALQKLNRPKEAQKYAALAEEALFQAP